MYDLIVGVVCIAYIFFVYGYSHNKYYESDFNANRTFDLVGTIRFLVFFISNLLLYPFLLVYSFGWLVSAFDTLSFLSLHLRRLEYIRDGQAVSIELRTVSQSEQMKATIKEISKEA